MPADATSGWVDIGSLVDVCLQWAKAGGTNVAIDVSCDGVTAINYISGLSASDIIARNGPVRSSGANDDFPAGVRYVRCTTSAGTTGTMTVTGCRRI